MKLSHFLLAAGLSLGLMLPVSAMAKPVPPHCVQGHGKIKCDKPECRKYCDNHGKKGPDHHAKPGPGHHGKPGPGHHAKPAPTPHHPAPPPPHGKPGPGHHVKPAPAPHHPAPPPPHANRAQIENRMRALIHENERLAQKRNKAVQEANNSYEICMRMHAAVRKQCRKQTENIIKIENKMKQNDAEIARLQFELRKF